VKNPHYSGKEEWRESVKNITKDARVERGNTEITGKKGAQDVKERIKPERTTADRKRNGDVGRGWGEELPQKGEGLRFPEGDRTPRGGGDSQNLEGAAEKKGKKVQGEKHLRRRRTS